MLGGQEGYKGFQIFSNNIRMTLQMHLNMLKFVVLVYSLSTFYFVKDQIPFDNVKLFFRYFWSKVLVSANLNPEFEFIHDGKWLKYTAEEVVYYSAGIVSYVLDPLKKVAFWKLLWALPVYVLGLYLFYRFSQKSVETKHIRGNQMITEKELRRAVKRQKMPCDLKIGSIDFPVKSETEHVCIFGSSGTGKTSMLLPVIKRLMERQEKGVIFDWKGDFTSMLYRPGVDHIFNPLDQRCVGWSLFNEIQNEGDVHRIVNSLIPLSNGKDPHWENAARDVCFSVLMHLYQKGNTENQSIWKTISLPTENLIKELSESVLTERGLKHLPNADSRMAQSVLAVLIPYLSVFDYIPDGDFSIDEWVEEGSGWIFVSSKPDLEDAIRPALSVFIETVASKLLSMPDDSERRLFFFFDEFGNLQKLDSVVKLITGARSKGGSVWLSTQGIGKLDKVYGNHIRSEMINSCSTCCIFRAEDPDTAKYLSRKIGEMEIDEKRESYSWGVSDNRDGGGVMAFSQNKSVLLPAEIMALPRFETILKVSNIPNSCKIKIKPPQLQASHAPFIERNDMSLSYRIEQAQKTIPSTMEPLEKTPEAEIVEWEEDLPSSKKEQKEKEEVEQTFSFGFIAQMESTDHEMEV